MTRRLVGVAALIGVVACGGAAAPSSTSPPVATNSAIGSATTAATTVPLLPSVETEIRACTSSPPRDWSILCRSYELLLDSYVDPLVPAELAAAAVLGIEQASLPGTSDPVGETFRCTIPDAAFERLCDAVLDRVRSGSGRTPELVEAGVAGMFRYALDPFSSYVPPDLADDFVDLGSGFVYDLGIGVSARTDSGEVCGVIDDRCRLRVITVFPLTPAAGAGMLVDDIVVEVDGEQLDGLSAEEATARLFGRPGVVVEVVVERVSGRVTKSMVREDFRFDPVEFEMLDRSLAYLRLNEFTQTSAQLVGQVLQLPEVESADAMILDLRDNPGGLVLAVQAIASQFLDGGSVMIEIGRDYRYEVEVIDGGLARPSMRLFVLVNRASASASEVLAGVLQERDRAVVIGESTYGKNLVQQVFSAGNGGELRITIARWETPGGTDIAITGLEPDIIVEPDTTGSSDPIFSEALMLAGR